MTDDVLIDIATTGSNRGIALQAEMMLRRRKPCDPMHGPVNGTSQKGPDDRAIPGCRSHHEEQHAIGWPAFEAKYGFSREAEAKVWYTAWTLVRESQA